MTNATVSREEDVWQKLRFIEVSYQSPRSGPRRWVVHLSLHLVLGDLVILGLFASTRTAWLLHFSWFAGSVGCALFQFVSALGFHVWSNVASVTALDVAYAVWAPLRAHSEGSARVKRWLGLAWLLAALTASPQLVLWSTTPIPPSLAPGGVEGLEQCVFGKGASPSLAAYYQLYHVLAVFYLPLAVIAASYIAVAYLLFWKNRDRSQQSLGSMRSQHLSAPASFANLQEPQSPAQLTLSPGQRRSMASFNFEAGRLGHLRRTLSTDATVTKHDRLRCRRSSGPVPHTRFLKQGSLVVGAFVGAWLPYQLLVAARMACATRQCADRLAVWDWLEGFVMAGACLNPAMLPAERRRAGPRPRVLHRLPLLTHHFEEED